ncbi:CYFIP-related Rac1 interactor B-like isoform X2 [Syngnathoides biaculeatus]|uniref:CYFIP-related Rac1 interactor B-like isoform X2 n=1 Tax=Syngnathoides biaculeatus TaxID=300417 RepID=UPI002ADD81F1|nr:CYFIP-related Rac1 interactor B-like isoform X2 [Syngnathoides biaculeatus]
MGNLIKVLSRDIDNNAGNFFLDFENAEASWSEKDVWEKVDGVLTEARLILDELQAYEGAGEEIRTAIRSPSEEGVQERAWSAVLPLVAKLKRFYQFSHELEASLRCLLEIFSNPETPPTQQLETKQALARQFALILHFTLRFDELKMTIPAIQNDFSYYRRTISRMRINNLRGDADTEVDNELANRMSLFYASATPMLKTLSDATIKFVSDVESRSSLGEHHRLSEHHGQRVQSHAGDTGVQKSLRQRGDVAVLSARDGGRHHPLRPRAPGGRLRQDLQHRRERMHSGAPGAAGDQRGRSPGRAQVRYTTKHLNDEATPKHIRNMLSNN